MWARSSWAVWFLDRINGIDRIGDRFGAWRCGSKVFADEGELSMFRACLMKVLPGIRSEIPLMSLISIHKTIDFIDRKGSCVKFSAII